MDESVRLTVLHHAAKQADAQALPLSKEFARDASPLVANEASRYLRERR